MLSTSSPKYFAPQSSRWIVELRHSWHKVPVLRMNNDVIILALCHRHRRQQCHFGIDLSSPFITANSKNHNISSHCVMNKKSCRSVGCTIRRMRLLSWQMSAFKSRRERTQRYFGSRQAVSGPALDSNHGRSCRVRDAARSRKVTSEPVSPS